MTERPPILHFFAYKHLPEHLQIVSKPFHELANGMFYNLPNNAETSTCLRKLLEAKDCAVRAASASQPSEKMSQLGGLYQTPGAMRAAERIEREASADRDPITGNPLPAGSPYSMAHAVQVSTPTPAWPHGKQRSWIGDHKNTYRDANGIQRFFDNHEPFDIAPVLHEGEYVCPRCRHVRSECVCGGPE
jgi:hypothetical protein